jgi:group I intron endonuclease
MLRYNNSNFSLYILEYCEFKLLRKREQYYIDLLKPEYNILKIAGSRLGHILSKETKLKISLSLKSKPKYNKPRIVTNQTKLKLSLKNKGINIIL